MGLRPRCRLFPVPNCRFLRHLAPLWGLAFGLSEFQGLTPLANALCPAGGLVVRRRLPVVNWRKLLNRERFVTRYHRVEQVLGTSAFCTLTSVFPHRIQHDVR